MGIRELHRRYILVSFYPKPPSIPEFLEQLKTQIRYFAGEISLQASDLHCFKFYNQKNHIVVRANQNERNVVEASISLLRFNKTYLQIESVYGTVKSLKRKAFN